MHALHLAKRRDIVLLMTYSWLNIIVEKTKHKNISSSLHYENVLEGSQAEEV